MRKRCSNRWGKIGPSALVPLLCLLLSTIMAITPAKAQDAAGTFRQNCVSCHTIGGGRLTGPDLKNVTERAERGWLVQFIRNPRSLLDRGDPYALQLQQEARGVVMPSVPRLTEEMATALLDLIEEESALEKSQFAGLQISDRPFTAADVTLGRKIFSGRKPLSRSGPACIACHTMTGLGGLGGGRLGPDLTRVFERLEGRKTLSAWLFAPATPTMQPVFLDHPIQPEEILPLVAFFEEAARRGGEDDSVGLLGFLLLGLGGCAMALITLGALWRERLRAVRQPLIQGEEARGRG